MGEIEVNASNIEPMTLNQISKITRGHYQTVKKIIDRLVRDNRLTETEIRRQNRPFVAYNVNNSILAEISIELQNIKKTMGAVGMVENVFVKSDENKRSKRDTSQLNRASENANVRMVDNETNIKLYEVVKQNNELENQISMLKAQYKDLELAKMQEVTKLTGENVQLQADLYKAQSEVKMIEDKSKTMEAAYSEQKLEVERLNNLVRSEADRFSKALYHRNIALIILSAVLLVFATVCIMVALLR